MTGIEWTTYRSGDEYVVITYSDPDTGQTLAALRMTVPGARRFFAAGYAATHRLNRLQAWLLRRWSA